MKREPFELIRRKVEVDGVRIFLQHRGCSHSQINMLIRDDDDLTTRQTLACTCGLERDFYFSDPDLGRRLIEILKQPEARDRFYSASEGSAN